MVGKVWSRHRSVSPYAFGSKGNDRRELTLLIRTGRIEDGKIYSYSMNYNGIDKELIGNDDGQGVGTVAGDSGLLGKTLLPNDAAIQRSPDSNIYVIVNSGMSDMSKAEMFAHEGYGHAAVYISTGSHDQATHDYKNIDGEFKDMNRYLFELINRAMNEVINNNK